MTSKSAAEQSLQASAESLLAQITDEFIARLDRGERPDIEEFSRGYPQFADVLRNVLPALQVLRSATSGSLRDAAVSAGVGEPQCLGDFRIVREIGRGGMGIVYEAEQLSLGRRVALKVFPLAAVLDSKQLQRFKNEAQAAAQLDHPNIVHVHYVGCERGVHYYAMQFIEGQTLAEVIGQLRQSSSLGEHESVGNALRGVPSEPATRAYAAMPERNATEGVPYRSSHLSTALLAALSTEHSAKPREFFRKVVRLGIQAAEGLDHAHQVGIVHRDIKPSNLLLDVRGNLWITDFGLARVGTNANLTMTGDLVGTLRYMSPEQALAKRVIVDHRTDVYSLGVTLYELLTLEPAFSAEDRQEILRQIAFDEPQPPRKTNPAIPAELETIVLKAMAKNPSERYATAQELADDLRRHLDDKAILARRPGMVRRLVKWSLRHKPIVWSAAAATAAAVVVLAASVGWIISDRDWRQNETEREVTRALHEAEELMSRTSWPGAKTAVSRADGLLVTGRADEELRQRVQQLHQDLQMVERLEQVREDDAAMLDGVHDYAALDQRFEQAFCDYGIDVLGGWRSSLRDPSTLDRAAELGLRRLDPRHPDSGIAMDNAAVERAAEQIKQRAIRRELVAALDHWAVVRRNAGTHDTAGILAVARAADPDELRGRIRDYLERNDLESLLHVSSSQEIGQLSTDSAVLLAGALSEAGRADRAVAVLETARHRNPGDLWVNLLLADNLHELSRWDEMLHFSGIAHALRPTSGAARLSIADALRHKGSLDESAALCEEVIELKPDNPHAYEMLGLVREDRGDWGEAATQFRRAIELHPTYVEALNHLGRCLTRQGDLDAAIAELRKAIELKPTYAGPHENLGVALARKGQFDEAMAELHKAIVLDPKSAQAHTDLGVILVRRGQVSAGIKEHRQAIALNPDSAEAHNNLGNALRISNELDSAAAEYRTAIELKPHLAAPRWNLAQTLMDQAKFSEALVHLQHGHETSLRDRYGPYPWTARLRECERLLVLDGKLPAVLAGTEPVANATERSEYAMLCYSKRLFATAARFYERAFADEPSLAEDSDHPRRYTAACSAALAGCAQDEGLETREPTLDDTERHRLRQQALDWLRTDLTRHATVLGSGNTKERQLSTRQLQHWLADPDLKGVRDAESLAKLPDSEQAAWRKLWSDVAEALKTGSP